MIEKNFVTKLSLDRLIFNLECCKYSCCLVSTSCMSGDIPSRSMPTTSYLEMSFTLFQFLGPASSLFEKSYYELMKKALKPGGIVCCQGKLNGNRIYYSRYVNNFYTIGCTP